MIRIRNLTGVPSPSGGMIIGQGYSHAKNQNTNIFIDDGQPFTWNYKENGQKYLLRSSQDNQVLDFRPTIRSYVDQKIVIQSNQVPLQEIKDLSDTFLSGITSFAIEGVEQYFPSSATVPVFIDALAYNTIVQGKNYIDPVNEWRWFRVECADALGFFGPCSGGSSQVSKNTRTGINYTGYYTNLYNIHPQDSDVWLYDVVEYGQSSVLIHAHSVAPQPAGATWGNYLGNISMYLYSGRKLAYYQGGKPKFYPVQNFTFGSTKSSIRWINRDSGVMCPTPGHGGPYYPFEVGISGYNNRYIDGNIPISFTNIANSGEKYIGLKSNTYGYFYYNNGINRWTFTISGNVCYPSGYRERPGGPVYVAPAIEFTGNSDSDYPWQTSWPSGIRLTLVN